MFMPTGEIFLVYVGGHDESIAIEDLSKPKAEILEDDYILDLVKYRGYKNIEAIEYRRNNKIVRVSMAEYYAENGEKLEA